MTPTLELAQALIARASVTPDDAGCQSLLQHRLEALGFKCEAMRFGDVDNLWARYGNSGPLLVFAGHTDVVPPGPADDWHSPPFTPTIKDGILYGRGASDMKSAIAASICAAEEFIHSTPSFKGSIAFLITSDEEGASINGTKKVIEALTQRGEKIDYCIVGEPSSKKSVGDKIRIGRRGSLHGKLKVHGKQGHVARPHLAANPIHLCLLALNELAQTVWDQGNQQFPPTIFQISNIHSGTGAANVIPGHLEALFNFRFSTAVTVDELKARTKSIFDHYKLNYEIDWTIGAMPFLTKKGKLIDIVTQAIKATTGLDTIQSTGGGTSDARFIAPIGAEVVELGVSNATAHHIDEHVSINDLEMLTRCYVEILNLLFK